VVRLTIQARQRDVTRRRARLRVLWFLPSGAPPTMKQRNATVNTVNTDVIVISGRKYATLREHRAPPIGRGAAGGFDTLTAAMGSLFVACLL
jgi:hypothetical protein